jgi:endonuclease YncB( thermonuclease family)
VVVANDNVIYAGKFEAQIKTVKSANKMELKTEVWPGYDRKFKITLAHISVPEAYDEAPACHLQLIEDGKKYTKKFIRNAEKVYVQGIAMKNSREEYGTAEIYNQKTELGKELIKHGYARADSVPQETPWCQDEE